MYMYLYLSLADLIQEWASQVSQDLFVSYSKKFEQALLTYGRLNVTTDFRVLPIPFFVLFYF